MENVGGGNDGDEGPVFSVGSRWRSELTEVIAGNLS